MSQNLPETKAPVSPRAALQRVNRKLALDRRALRVCKQSSRWHSSLGNYYEVDLGTNSITAQHVDVEAWAREMNVLKPYEFVKYD